MNKINVKEDCKVLFIGDSITDVRLNRRKRFSIKDKIYMLYS